MVQVKYIGLKPIKTDNVAGTATVWVGQGDVQSVTPEVWAKLQRHDTVWQEVAGATDEQEQERKQEPKPNTAPEDIKRHELSYVIVRKRDGTEKTADFSQMDADSIRAFLDAEGLAVDGRIKNLDTLRAAAFKAATEA